MTVTVVFTSALAEEVLKVSQEPVETAGVLLASVVRAPNGDVRLLARRLIWLAASAYDRRAGHELLINAPGYISPLSVAAELRSVPIWVHTHPGKGASPRPSHHDHLVDEQIADVFKVRS